MEPIKEFFKSPKKTAILGLVGSIIMLPTSFYAIGLLIYFLIILLRLYKQKGSLKIANIILIAVYIYQSYVGITTILKIKDHISLSNDMKYFFIVNIVYTIICILLAVYFLNILFRKIHIINNKVFTLCIIALSVLLILQYVYTDSFTTIKLLYLGYLLIIPYFYNYYNLLKEEN